MFTPDQAQQLSEVVASAHSILVVLPPQPSLDQTAAALALSSSLESQNKQVVVISPRPLGEESSELIGADAISQQIGNRDLAVSFAYTPEAVDKVSYHIDEQQQRFYLVIKPQTGHKPLTQDTVEFSYTGAEADVIFLIGVHSYESLEHLYFGYEQLYQTAITVSFHTYQPEIGTFKLDASGTSSLSESMSYLLQHIGWQIKPDAATNLLRAIEDATDRYQSLSTSAETFEATAWLLRSGARRSRRLSSPQPQAIPPVQPVRLTPPEASKKSKNNSRKQQADRKNDNPGDSSSSSVGSLKHQPTGFGPGGGG